MPHTGRDLMNRHMLSSLLVSAAFFCCPAQSWAQDATAATQAPRERADAEATGEIVVTARKVTESLQDAPAAIDVLQSGRLEKMGVTDIRAVQYLVPSVRLNKQQSVVQMFIRGVGIASDSPSLDMGVAMTFNGIEQFREATGSSLFDIGRVEVLRGPQATTYGSNAAGGVVNVVFARPKNDYSGRASVEYGNFDRLHISAAQNLPLGEQAEVRFAGDFLRRDGYASNGLDDQKTIAGRVTLTARPGDNFDFMIWASHYHAGGLGDAGYATPFINKNDPWKQTWDRNAILAHSPDQIGQRRDIDLTEIGGEFNLDLGQASLTYIPGYIKIDHVGHLVIDTGAARILFEGDSHREQITHEVRLTGTDTSSPLKWLTGLYYYSLDTAEVRTVAVNKVFDIPEQPTRTIAGYAQLTYELVDGLRFTGGLRYSKIEKSIRGARFRPGPASSNPAPIPFTADFEWDHVDWKAGVEYDLTPDSMLYASAQTGYLGGAVNFYNSPTQSNEVKPEELKAYIVGMKNSFLDNRLRLNWEAFYYDWRNYQVGLFNVAAGTSVVFNAPKSESYGFELDSDFRFTDDDRVSLAVGLFHGEFTDFIVPAGVSSPVRAYDFTGFDVPFAPRLSATFSYEHTFRLSNGSRLVANGLVQYTSSFWASFSHGITRCSNVPPAVLTQEQCVDQGLRQPRAAVVNLDLTWHSPDDEWELGIWARNLTDRPIRTSGGDGGMNALGVVTSRAATTLSPPRTFGVRLVKSW